MSSIGWHPHPSVWVIIVIAAFSYRYAVKTVGPRILPAGTEVVSRRQVRWFGLGLAALFIGADWPIHDLAEGYLYSVHMVQHMLFSLVVPPLLLIGIPAWLWRYILGGGIRLKVVRFLTRPVVALVSFNTVLAISHIPSVVDASVKNEPLHFFIHALVFGSALQMWTPVLSPLLELPALNYPARMFYLFLQSLVPTIPASFLTFGDGILYKVYATFPRIWGLSARTDQQIAGLLMKIGGGFLLWGVILVLFFRWHAAEQDGWDALSLRDVEADVRNMTAGGVAKP